MTVTAAPTTESIREKALSDYRKKLLEHKEVDGRLKESERNINNCNNYLVLTIKYNSTIEREELKELTKLYDKSENDLKALQSVGQIVGEVLKQLTEDKCKYLN